MMTVLELVCWIGTWSVAGWGITLVMLSLAWLSDWASRKSARKERMVRERKTDYTRQLEQK